MADERIPALQQEIANLHMMLDASVDCIKLIDRYGNLLKMNRAGCNALGVTPESLLGMKWLPLLPPEVRTGGRRALKACLDGKATSFAGKSQLPGCKPVYWDNILTPLKDRNGNVFAILCVSRNITRQRVAERRLRVASDFDALTDIPNRRYLTRHASRVIRSSAKKNGFAGLLVIDVDHFKAINDSRGHHCGDAAIRHIAHALKKKLREGEFLARLGGDEFAILIEHVACAQDMADVALRCIHTVGCGFTYQARHIPLSLSIGGAFRQSSETTLSILMKQADNALYVVKQEGRGWFHISAPDEQILASSDRLEDSQKTALFTCEEALLISQGDSGHVLQSSPAVP